MKLFNIRHPSVPLSMQPPPIQTIPTPSRIILPLYAQGEKAQVRVSRGEKIERGQCIAESRDILAPPVLAPLSGKVTDIRPWPGFRGNEVLSVGIETDGGVEGAGDTASDDIALRDPRKILNQIARAGINEVDSPSWPLAFRIASPELVIELLPSPPEPLTRPIETLILNGLDRQPGVFVRRSALVERETDVLDAMVAMQKTSSAKRMVVAVAQDQHLSVYFQLRTKELGIEVVRCKKKYPIALEPILTQFITRREVPQPANDTRRVGAAVVDVTTALRLVDGLRSSSPPADVTVQVNGPKGWAATMVRVPKGMILEDLLQQLPPFPQTPAKIVVGGLLLGYAQHSLQVPITEEVDSITIQSQSEVICSSKDPCCNCGYCVLHCPMRLLPNELGRYVEYGRFEEAERNGLFHCIECGICSYVCPARRPLIHLVRFGKLEITQMRNAS